VSPIFGGERREPRRSYLDDQGGFTFRQPQYEEEEPEQPARPERVYQDDPFESDRNQPRRGFSPDVPSFLRRK